MKTIIHIQRYGSDGYRHTLPVIVERTTPGPVRATVETDIYSRTSTTRYGEPEWIQTSSIAWQRGESISLTPPEIIQAHIAFRTLEADWQQAKAKLSPQLQVA